jgi:hypothetical protein
LKLSFILLNISGRRKPAIATAAQDSPGTSDLAQHMPHLEISSQGT